MLEHLDISGNPIDAEGIIDIAEAVREHPRLRRRQARRRGAADLRSCAAARAPSTVIEFGDKALGELSGHMIGIVAQEQPHHATAQPQVEHRSAPAALNAVVSGLGDAPLKALDLTRTGIGSEAARSHRGLASRSAATSAR